MSIPVTVVDYGMGNLFSVTRALEHCGGAVTVADSPERIRQSSRIVLPGVGAFADGMRELRERRLEAPVIDFAHSGRPLLGICLGMQMLLSESEEFGIHSGLGLIPGKVVAIPRTSIDGRPHKIPHIGWNKLLLPKGRGTWNKTILSDLTPGDAVYFVHSYAPMPDNPEHRLADCYYGGRVISAAIRSGSIYGCQFHPEKSGNVGLDILRRFLNAVS